MNDSASTPLRHALDRARDLIRNAHRIEVFTGAGMSADSGLATYRDPDSGIWENVDPQDMASIDAWAKDPIRMWRWYAHRRHQAEKAQPNAGHIALAQWDKEVTVTTQNIDNLHERAGTDDVVHLHGSLFAFRCCMCGRPWRGGSIRILRQSARSAGTWCGRASCGSARPFPNGNGRKQARGWPLPIW